MRSTRTGFGVERCRRSTSASVEHTGSRVDADEAAAKYFGTGGDRDWNTLADYYRSRQTGCVVFTVHEKLTGRPQVSNDAVIGRSL